MTGIPEPNLEGHTVSHSDIDAAILKSEEIQQLVHYEKILRSLVSVVQAAIIMEQQAIIDRITAQTTQE